ncbi:hypothetical protein BC938DRAFT_484092 [Jimgerdemannia flammicorona]|uniref:Uncharacterized protein n=1 Tax=Jimgerdemannia flammicorona TaxID=994334 RepID=A0A433QAJ5_9FUNG|nr:hypothetical protein BC938DRAFT_484092 [Jimgerdemannia flammicorona]
MYQSAHRTIANYNGISLRTFSITPVSPQSSSDPLVPSASGPSLPTSFSTRSSISTPLPPLPIPLLPLPRPLPLPLPTSTSTTTSSSSSPPPSPSSSKSSSSSSDSSFSSLLSTSSSPDSRLSSSPTSPSSPSTSSISTSSPSTRPPESLDGVAFRAALIAFAAASDLATGGRRFLPGTPLGSPGPEPEPSSGTSAGEASSPRSVRLRVFLSSWSFMYAGLGSRDGRGKCGGNKLLTFIVLGQLWDKLLELKHF